MFSFFHYRLSTATIYRVIFIFGQEAWSPAWFFISLWWLLPHWLWINHLKSCLRKPLSEGGKKWTVTFPNHYVLRVSCLKRVLERCSDLKRILNEHTIFSPNAPHGKFITVCCWESNTTVFISRAFCLRLRAILFLLQPTGVCATIRIMI